jgi:catalase
MTDWEKTHITEAFQLEQGKVERTGLRERVVKDLAHADHQLASDVAEGLGLPPGEAEPNHGRSSPALSQAVQPGSAATRKVAVRAADGVDAGSLRPVLDRLREQGAVCDILAPHAGELEGGVHVDRPAPTDPHRGDALLLADIRGLKEANDQYGHSVGDQLLVDVGDALRATAAPHDVIGRFGGDEFAVIMCGESAPDRANAYAAEVQRELDRLHDDRPARLTVALGQQSLADVQSGAEALERADDAMYRRVA